MDLKNHEAFVLTQANFSVKFLVEFSETIYLAYNTGAIS